jgi:hypothetical protein
VGTNGVACRYSLNDPSGSCAEVRQIPGGVRGMHSIFYIIGVVVMVLAILSFLGFG